MRAGIAAVVAVAVAIAFGVGVAKATIPDATGAIHGCFALDGGKLRAIDTGAAATCDAGTEVPLDWNLTGGQGATGLPGPQGVQGFQGLSGAAGNGVASGYERVSASFATDGTGVGTGEADCSDGKLVGGGGVATQSQSYATASRPTDAGDGWTADLRGIANRQYSVYAICVTATAKGGGQ
jgi:hypothetical protein